MDKSPIAVLVADVHYNINTLEVADRAMRMAINKANSLNVRLIVCGDLHDTKANLRGECVKAILSTLSLCKRTPIVLIGNHDRLNEKSNEHALEFLCRDRYVENEPSSFTIGGTLIYFCPYQSDPLKFQFQSPNTEAIITIMHQGVTGSLSGEYYHDKSAISVNDLAGRRVISGHYHTRQQFALPNGGLMDYVGNPYTLNFGEANDPEKGFQILHDDGSLEFVPTNLRKHVIYEHETGKPNTLAYNQDDILWVKVKGDSDKLASMTKKDITKELNITIPFKFDLIPNAVISDNTQIEVSLPATEKLDKSIESLDIDLERKDRLKTLWKSLYEV